MAESGRFPKNEEKCLPNLSERRENDATFLEENSSDENDAKDFSERGDDIIVPEIPHNDDKKESLRPRGGKYNLRPNPNPNYSEEFRYEKRLNSAQK